MPSIPAPSRPTGRVARRTCRLAACFLLLAAAACGGDSRPRLALLLTSDTLRSDRLGAYGSELGLSPNLDALLAESTLFRAAYAPSSYTLPSVSALLTGRYPEELGLFSNASRMGSDFATLAGVLGLYGWQTGAVVSNYVLRTGTGFEQGFDIYDASFPQRERNRDMPERVGEDTTEAGLAVLDRLIESGAESIFLWVHYQDPHGPYTPPEPLRERYLEAERAAPGGDRELPTDPRHRGIGGIPAYQLLDGRNDVAFYRAGYDGEVAFLDQQVGLLLEGIEARGLLDDAVVVFTADHGESLGERDYWFAHGEYLDDPLVRVPLAVRVPGRAPAERSDVASLVDVFPTLLSALGVQPPAGYPGRDLLEPGADDEDREAYLAVLRGAPVPRWGLVADGHRYVRSHEPEGLQEALYPLDAPDRDRAEQDPARLARMRERLDELRRGLRSAPERRQQLSPDERERLRQLGYVVD